MAEKKHRPRGPQLDLAGALGVAFVNTAGARPNNGQQGVESYAELLSWAQGVGVISALELESLRRLASERPHEAEAVYAKADRWRLVLARLFDALAAEQAVPENDLDAFNAALVETLSAQRVVPGAPGLVWGWTADDEALDRVLWPVMYAAAETLVATAGRPVIRQCDHPDCALYFVDRTPSLKRRWCEMKTCGNRAKSLGFYYRTGRERRDEQMRRTYQWSIKRPRKKKT